ncbi:low temperature requirement protein A [Cryobacterium sp. SO2]|uniref:low temperature requirement protein A n=1 Tax=Cryobacterium sp. SO2 TaxID=1897060 RepID=UPI00223D7B4A|nr:low temperature requirement protein A [Cryobacterium sp. SO2]WEO78766.1 low temperature requirement protein A [Cryobacterium sp. SO2]
MTGRDPEQTDRAATPLELLFDLTFVVAFGQAGDQLAHAIAEGHTASGIVAFVFAVAATCWAWINFSWFASAYDTDDWFYRLSTMVQMIGVVVFALGIPVFFVSIEHGGHVDNGVLVSGYVVMRVALMGQWLRAAAQDPDHRGTALRYALCVGVAQAGWIALAILNLDVAPFFLCAGVLFAVELLGPILAERHSSGSPWHPHHLAERYGLLAIITLGEGIFGTVAAVAVLVQEQGWSSEAVIVVVAGVGLTFGLWWSYFTMPSGRILARFRSRLFGWGYGHILIYGSIVAVGAGLHVSAYVIEGRSSIGVVGAILAVAVPALLFSITMFTLYTFLLRTFDPFHIALLAGTVLLLVAAILLATAGASLGVCLLVVTFSPAVVVVGFEVVGRRHQADALDRIL